MPLRFCYYRGMGQPLPQPLYKLPREERNAAAREVARYCLLPDPTPPDHSFLARTGRWLSRTFGGSEAEQAKDRADDALKKTKTCIAREISGKMPGEADVRDLSRTEYHEILTEACRREAIGRQKGQVRDFHDWDDKPSAPITPPRHIVAPICRALIHR